MDLAFILLVSQDGVQVYDVQFQDAFAGELSELDFGIGIDRAFRH